jgi:hypothetical protein
MFRDLMRRIGTESSVFVTQLVGSALQPKTQIKKPTKTL